MKIPLLTEAISGLGDEQSKHLKFSGSAPWILPPLENGIGFESAA